MKVTWKNGKPLEFPDTFEREIRSISQSGAGWSVTFRCGHTVWFAIKPIKGNTYNCTVCFDAYFKARRAANSADKE